MATGCPTSVMPNRIRGDATPDESRRFGRRTETVRGLRCPLHEILASSADRTTAECASDRLHGQPPAISISVEDGSDGDRNEAIPLPPWSRVTLLALLVASTVAIRPAIAKRGITSKPAGRCSPTVGRFDSCAAPLLWPSRRAATRRASCSPVPTAVSGGRAGVRRRRETESTSSSPLPTSLLGAECEPARAASNYSRARPGGHWAVLS